MAQTTTGDDSTPATGSIRVARRDEPLSPAAQAALERRSPDELQELADRANRR